MFRLFVRWFNRNFSDPQAVSLLLILVFGFTFVLLLSDIFAPIFVAIVIAYLLEGLVSQLTKRKLSRKIAVPLVSITAIFITLLFSVGLLPSIWGQLGELITDLPSNIKHWQQVLLELQARYPDYLSQQQVTEFTAVATKKIGEFGESILGASIGSLVSLVALLVYLVLVPLLIYFFLVDKRKIIDWCLRWLPKERKLANQVWMEVNQQLANYVRGKVLEITIVGTVSWVTFSLMGLNYALLLGILVGLSVIIPYVGAAVVTFPVLFVAYAQWGFTAEFGYIALAYGIIQALDGNVLVPILFSEAVNLHPVAIISSVLFFGGIWGIWGVFFAIPLATLVKAVIDAWGDVRDLESGESAG